jgi:hypothetical protein
MSKLTDYEVTAFVAFVMSTISMDTRLRLVN